MHSMTRTSTRLICIVLSVLAPGLVPAQDPSRMTVIDLRPKEEREGNQLAPLTGECNEKIFRIPDAASAPNKVVLLEADLLKHIAVLVEGKTLTVLNWSIYYNKFTRSSGPRLTGIGVQGYSLPGQKKKDPERGSHCAKEKTAGGWFDGSEVTGPYPPLVSEFQGTFNGKLFTARAVVSPQEKIPGKFEGGEKDNEVLYEAIRQTAFAVIEALPE
jgi:hypothetical protein